MEKMIFANQKMYFNSDDVKEFQRKMLDYKDKFVVIPSYLYLESFKELGFNIGAQNVSMHDNGAHTGEISAEELKSVGCQYVIIGHSEVRNSNFNEEKAIISKISKAINAGLKVIFCVGETCEERRDGHTLDILDKQLTEITNSDVIISYEPIWAVGSGKIPSNEEIIEVINHIKSKGNFKVLYGGSVSDKNIEVLNEVNSLDGFLLGESGTNPEKLKKIIEVVLK